MGQDKSACCVTGDDDDIGLAFFDECLQYFVDTLNQKLGTFGAIGEGLIIRGINILTGRQLLLQSLKNT